MNQLFKQEYYEDNRQRFDAETTAVSAKIDHCTHTKLFRKSATEVQCACGAGWVDNGIWKIQNGKVS